MGLTPEQYLPMLARLDKNKAREVTADACSREIGRGGLHEEILTECRRRGWIALHSSTAHRTHRMEGEPDFCVIADKGKILFLEAKCKSKLSSAQQEFIAWARKLGTCVHIVRSLADTIAVFDHSQSDDTYSLPVSNPDESSST